MKKLKVLLIGLLTVATVTFSMPKKSEALLPLYIVALLHSETIEEVIAINFVCILVLPLCILEEDANGGISPDALLAQGYSETEIQGILEGQKATLNHIDEIKNSQPELEKATIDLSQVAGMTEEYYEFASENF